MTEPDYSRLYRTRILGQMKQEDADKYYNALIDRTGQALDTNVRRDVKPSQENVTCKQVLIAGVVCVSDAEEFGRLEVFLNKRHRRRLNKSNDQYMTSSAVLEIFSRENTK